MWGTVSTRFTSEEIGVLGLKEYWPWKSIGQAYFYLSTLVLMYLWSKKTNKKENNIKGWEITWSEAFRTANVYLKQTYPCTQVGDSRLQCSFSPSHLTCQFYLLATTSLSIYFLNSEVPTSLQEHNSFHNSPFHSGSYQPLLPSPRKPQAGELAQGADSMPQRSRLPVDRPQQRCELSLMRKAAKHSQLDPHTPFIPEAPPAKSLRTEQQCRFPSWHIPTLTLQMKYRSSS